MLRLLAVLLLALLAPRAFACACGCGVFDVGTASMYPLATGGMVFLEDDLLDQNQNRSQASAAPASQNPDKEIRTNFLTVGSQYKFDRVWGVELDVPYWSRSFRTTNPSGEIVSYNHSALGDVRLRGNYTGLSEDMSIGVTFGVKLPTGDSTYANFDPDTEIGTGSTDLLLGVYHLGRFTVDNTWVWYAQVNLDQPLLTKATYIPGNEVDGALGSYYNGWSFSGENKIAPLLQLIASARGNDNGAAADLADSGYRRLLVSPGVEGDVGAFRIYADVGVPLWQYFNGDQLAAAASYKLSMSYGF